MLLPTFVGLELFDTQAVSKAVIIPAGTYLPIYIVKPQNPSIGMSMSIPKIAV